MRRTLIGCAVAVAIAGCSDATTAPAPQPSLTASASKSSGGTLTYIIDSTTFAEALVSCAGDPIAAKVSEKSVLTNYLSKDGTVAAAFVGTFDLIKGVGTISNATYTGAQASSALTALAPTTTVLTTIVQSIITSKGRPTTYASTISYFVMDATTGITLAKSYTYTGCTSLQAHAHDHDHDADFML